MSKPPRPLARQALCLKLSGKIIHGPADILKGSIPPSTLTLLRRSWLRLAITWLVIWVIGYRLLAPVWPWAGRWLWLSALTLVLFLGFLWQGLPANHRPGEPALLSTLGTGNRLTMLRGLAVGFVAGFLFSPWPAGALGWLPALLYTAASLIDGLDGYVARRGNRETVLGQKLDLRLDSAGVLIVSLLAIGYGQLPGWFLVVGLAHYVFLLGLWWRERQGQPIYELSPSVHRRLLAGMLMGMLTVVLWPIVPAAMTHVAAVVIAAPLLVGFGRDWLFASGRLHGAELRYQQVRRVAYRVLARWLPPLWRLLLGVAMLLVLGSADVWYRPGAWVALLASWNFPAAEATAAVLGAVGAVGGLLAVLGLAARAAAIFLFFPIGFDVATAGLSPGNALALVSALFIALYGSGLFSLWQPEDRLIMRRDRVSRPEPARLADAA